MDKHYFTDKPELAEVLNRLIRQCNHIDEEIIHLKIAINDLTKRIETLEKKK